MTTPLLNLVELGEADPLAFVKNNGALRVIEAHLERRLESVTLTAPPGSPAESSAYYIPANSTPTGAWAGHPGQIAVYVQGGWSFSTPKSSARWRVLEGTPLWRQLDPGGNWVAFYDGNTGQLARTISTTLSGAGTIA